MLLHNLSILADHNIDWNLNTGPIWLAMFFAACAFGGMALWLSGR